jgi:hypothetical protein
LRLRALGSDNPRLAKVAVGLFMLVLTGNAPAASAFTIYRLAPEADATVISSSPHANYGADKSLEAHNPSPSARAYLRFSLPPLDGPILAATLRVGPEASTPDGFSVRRASGAGWEESSITYANAPGWGSVLANSGGLTKDEVSKVDVTKLVKAAGSGPVDLVLTTSSTAKLRSRETDYPPKLALMTRSPALFSDDFDTPRGPNNLIANEHALWNPLDVLRVRSPDWQMTSGSFFSQDGVGWTGVPDDVAPDRYSIRSTGSSVFRMRTTRSDFPDNLQSVEARINSFSSAPSRPAVPWDGVVLWPRYKTEFNLYFAYILRKDGKVAITKKCPGGDPNGPNYYNGGTYYALSEEIYHAPTVLGDWYQLATSAQDNADGSVTITLYRGGDVAAQATDTGVGCTPIHAPTRLGLRADNVDANFSEYRVTALP